MIYRDLYAGIYNYNTDRYIAMFDTFSMFILSDQESIAERCEQLI